MGQITINFRVWYPLPSFDYNKINNNSENFWGGGKIAARESFAPCPRSAGLV